jgi:hypothetical protein
MARFEECPETLSLNSLRAQIPSDNSTDARRRSDDQDSPTIERQRTLL